MMPTTNKGHHIDIDATGFWKYVRKTPSKFYEELTVWLNYFFPVLCFLSWEIVIR